MDVILNFILKWRTQTSRANYKSQTAIVFCYADSSSCIISLSIYLLHLSKLFLASLSISWHSSFCFVNPLEESHMMGGGKDKKFSRKERNENFCWWTGWREYRKLTEVRQVVLLFPASLSLLPLCEDVASVDVGEDYSVSLKLWDGFQVWSFCGCQEPHGACDSFQGQTLRHAQINTRHSAFWDARKDSVSDVVWADVLSQFLSCQGCL